MAHHHQSFNRKTTRRNAWVDLPFGLRGKTSARPVRCAAGPPDGNFSLSRLVAVVCQTTFLVQSSQVSVPGNRRFDDVRQMAVDGLGPTGPVLVLDQSARRSEFEPIAHPAVPRSIVYWHVGCVSVEVQDKGGGGAMGLCGRLILTRGERT